VSLTDVTEVGRIGTLNTFTLSILSNDNPHGVVELSQEHYYLEERSTNSQQGIQVIRT